MPDKISDQAVFRAIKSHWDAENLIASCPGGLERGVVPSGTVMPYCVLDKISSTTIGNTNKSTFRGLVAQMKVYAANADDAELAAEKIGDSYGDAVLLIVGEGGVFSCDRGPTMTVQEGDDVWFSVVDFTIRRSVGRSRADFSGS